MFRRSICTAVLQRIDLNDLHDPSLQKRCRNATGLTPRAWQTSQNSTTSSLRSPRSYFDTNDCGRPSRSAKSTWVRPVLFLAWMNCSRSLAYSSISTEIDPWKKHIAQIGIYQNGLFPFLEKSRLCPLYTAHRRYSMAEAEISCSQPGALSNSLGREPSAWPTNPSRSIRSIKCAARP